MFLRFPLDPLCLLNERIDFVSCRRELLPQRVNLSSVLLIFSLGLIEFESLVVDCVLLSGHGDVLLFLLEGCRFLFRVGFLLFLKLLLHLLDLLVNCEQAVALLLKLSCKVIDFTLQTLGFSFMDAANVLRVSSVEGASRGFGHFKF